MLDITGSMGHIIEQAKNKLTEILIKSKQHYKGLKKSLWLSNFDWLDTNFRVAFVGYRDYGD